METSTPTFNGTIGPWTGRLLLGVGIGILISLLVLGNLMQSVREDVLHKKNPASAISLNMTSLQQAQLQNLAISCQILVSLNIDLPDSCKDKQLVGLYDPTAKPLRASDLQAALPYLCELLFIHGEVPVVCTRIPRP